MNTFNFALIGLNIGVFLSVLVLLHRTGNVAYMVMALIIGTILGLAMWKVAGL